MGTFLVTRLAREPPFFGGMGACRNKFLAKGCSGELGAKKSHPGRDVSGGWVAFSGFGIRLTYLP